MAWIYAVVFVVALVAAVALQPKAQTIPPAGFSEYVLPTAEEGREIGVLFGTRHLPSPNIVWAGDYRTVAIRVKP